MGEAMAAQFHRPPATSSGLISNMSQSAVASPSGPVRQSTTPSSALIPPTLPSAPVTLADHSSWRKKANGVFSVSPHGLTSDAALMDSHKGGPTLNGPNTTSGSATKLVFKLFNCSK